MLDLSSDYLVFDGRETVTCYSCKPPHVDSLWTPGSGISVEDARIEKIRAVEVSPSAGVYYRCDTRFRLPVTVCEEVEYVPEIGDLIEQSDSALWTVLQVGHPRFDNSWSCDVRQLLVSGGLQDSVDYYTASWTNVHGSKKTEHAIHTANIPCRIQPMGEQEVILQARMGYDVNYAIYTRNDIKIGHDDLFVDSTTRDIYEIKYSGDRGRIDVLSVYFCRRRP